MTKVLIVKVIVMQRTREATTKTTILRKQTKSEAHCKREAANLALFSDFAAQRPDEGCMSLEQASSFLPLFLLSKKWKEHL